MHLLRLVFIQDDVKVSYGLSGTVIEPGIDVNDFIFSRNVEGAGLVVGNGLERNHFRLDLIKELFYQGKIIIVGENPSLNTKSACCFNALKENYNNASVFVNLLTPPEAPYNLATLEAIFSGLPVLSVTHPEGWFVHGYNSLLFSSEAELSLALRKLKEEPDLAEKIVSNNYDYVIKRFSIDRFKEEWTRVLLNGK